MKTQKKNHPLNHKTVSSFVKKLTMSLYIVIAILSIMHHQIADTNNFLTELIIYAALGVGTYIVIKNISLKQIKEDLKLFFEND